MFKPSAHELVALRDRALDRLRERIRVTWIGAHRSVAAGLVERRMRRHNARHATGHGLEHRHAEALVERWVDEHRRTAVERYSLTRWVSAIAALYEETWARKTRRQLSFSRAL